MHSKPFDELLALFKEEADKKANELFKHAQKFEGKGIEGYILFDKIANPSAVHKAANDYHKLSTAFKLIFSNELEQERRGKAKKTLPINKAKSRNPLDNKTFSSEEVKALAICILNNDIPNFFQKLLKVSKNKDLTDRITIAIFGESYAHRKA